MRGVSLPRPWGCVFGYPPGLVAVGPESDGVEQKQRQPASTPVVALLAETSARKKHTGRRALSRRVGSISRDTVPPLWVLHPPTRAPAYTMSSPQRILITGAAGFIGQALTSALLESSPDLALTLTDVVEPPIPAAAAHHVGRVSAVRSDLTDPAAVAALLAAPFTAVYLLHGLMSGGAEANLELGWKVNWDSHR